MTGHTRPWARGVRAAGGTCAIALVIALTLAGCNNNPLPDKVAASNTLVTAFTEKSPRHLDPTASYWNNETPYTYQIYEPPYGYHYLKRPYTLVPKTAVEVAAPHFLDKDGKPLPADAPGELVAESIYDIRIKPGILYAPHPAFAKDGAGKHVYHAMKPGEIGDRRSPLEFEQGTRELVAEDYVYALKRQATTRITTPIYGIFSEYVLGLKEYGEKVKLEDAKLRKGLDPTVLDKPFLDFRQWPLAGATAPEKDLLRIRIKGKYPQWNYWMALTFLSPVPWEADAFYAQPGMATAGLSLDAWPVGTGPYMMSEYVQDRRHVMVKNPNYRGEPYPCDGMPEDQAAGLLADCGKPTPFIDKLVFLIEKEAVPLKSKFRQGYYDVPEIERTDYGVEYLVDMEDSAAVKQEYTDKGFKLPKLVDLSSWFLGFNMLDPVLGKGDTPEQQAKNRKLRQALSIAIDWEEFTRIFPKKGGETAMGPLPAGLFGSRHGTAEGLNPVTHKLVNGKAVRRPIEDAKALLAQAGYPGGRNATTGQPLVLNYDFYAQPTPERKAEFDWMIKQFAKLGVQLEIRATDNNQFQDKVRKGKHQIYWSGWLADYPDAENFLFLLYGPNAKSVSDGENTSNYVNPEFDKLYSQLKLLEDGPEKQALIDQMMRIAQEDSPWAWGYFPYASGAYQSWVGNGKPAILIRDMARYYKIDSAERVRKQAEWNQPVWWPLAAIAAFLLAVLAVGLRSFKRRERLNARGEVMA
jgi:ABC-type transport system substrate-binding protein